MTEHQPPPEPPQTFADKIGEWIDRAVLAVSPQRGILRMSARRMWRIAERRIANRTYEGAESDRLRGDKWMSSRLSPDSALEGDLESLRQRSREIYRNDSLGGVVDNRVNHVVGTGFTPQARVKETAGVVTKEHAELLNQQIESGYARIAPRIDRTRRKSLWQLTRLAERCIDVDGECLTVLSDEGDADAPIPLVVEVIDIDRLETPPDHADNPRIRMGIESDAKGKIVAYHIRKTNPHDTVETSEEYDRIDADRVLHVFEQWFPEQSRGLPWMTRVLNRTRDAKDLDEAEIIACQVQACYAGFVTGGAGGSRGALGAATDTTAGGQLEQDIRPGTIKYLQDGQEINFGNPTRPGNSYAPFMEWIYRRIAGGLNWCYEMMVKNWNGLSFAGGRLVLIDAKKDVGCRQQLIVEQFLAPIWIRIVTELVLAGELSIGPRAFARAKHLFTAHTWTAPKWEFAVNPLQEVQADIAEVNANFATKASKIAARGGDLEDVFDQRAIERKKEADQGIEPPDDLPALTTAETAQTEPEPALAA